MKVALLKFKYMNELEEALRLRGMNVVRTTPEKSLYLFLSNYVDAAVVSSVAAASLGLEPCLRCPAVYGTGRIENVKLIFINRSNKVKLWVTPKSFTGKALALWFLITNGIEFTLVDDRREADAMVEIGDEARELEGDSVDLGEAWFEATGSPMVYAVTVSTRPLEAEVKYVWRKIAVAPFEEVIDAYLAAARLLKDYWLRPLLLPRGLLGLLRSL